MFLIVINIVCNNVTIYFKDKIELHCKSYCVIYDSKNYDWSMIGKICCQICK